MAEHIDPEKLGLNLAAELGPDVKYFSLHTAPPHPWPDKPTGYTSGSAAGKHARLTDEPLRDNDVRTWIGPPPLPADIRTWDGLEAIIDGNEAWSCSHIIEQMKAAGWQPPA